MPPVERAIIFNPYAKSEQAGRFLKELQRLSPSAKLHPTTSPGAGAELARQLASSPNPPACVVAAGGDGTVNEVARGLHGVNLDRVRRGQPQIPLGLLPLGTMNVFSLEMKIPRNIHKAWGIIENGLTKNVDFWRAGDHRLLQLAGIGFDASVIRNTPRRDKKQLGPISYVISALGLLGEEHPPVTVRIPDRDPIAGRIVLVGNGRYYGGPFPLFPDASPTDGLLDLLILPSTAPEDLLRFFTGVARGRVTDMEDVISLKAAEFEIDSPGEAPFEVDGELVGATPLRISRDPLPMMVLC